ncbi:MAG: zinc transporter ZntB [Phycisphaerales bacterium]|nr:MAG: zinc transporter ZntB [Phycisphaerales bacterium]
MSRAPGDRVAVEDPARFVPMAGPNGVLVVADPAGVRRLPEGPIASLAQGPAAWRWLHLDHNRPATHRWLREGAGLPEASADELAEAMLALQTRPRCLRLDDGVLFIGRGVNLNDQALPEDMVSVRAWLTPGRLVTVVRRRLRAAEDLAEWLDDPARRAAIDHAGALLVRLLEGLLGRMAPIVAEAGEQMDDLLEALLDEQRQIDGAQLARLRLRALTLRRYVLPLREAIEQLRLAPPTLIDPDQHLPLGELADDAGRMGDDLHAVATRGELARGELDSQQARVHNGRLYALAIVTAIFLPLSFLTGLLGMNVAGVPFTTQPWAFAFWAAVFAVVLLGQLVLLRRVRWL